MIPCAISDHSLIYCTVKSGVSKGPPRIIEYRSYRTYDKSAFVNDLKEVDWDMVIRSDNINSAVNYWNEMFLNIINRHAPLKRTRVKGIQIPWMTPNLNQAMRDRDYHHRKAIKKQSSYHWEMYRKLKGYVNKQVKKCKSDYYLNIIEENKSHSERLWKAIGLDQISGRLLKDASAVISNSLTQLFNRSRQLGTFPNVWKMGKVTALFKSGSRNDTN